MQKVRWAVLSTAKIGLEKVIPAMQRGETCQVIGIASREPERARRAADRLGLAKSYGSYQELLADPEIDAVYNPLPNHLHVSWTIRALEAGKHVLCEKPIGLSAADGQRLVEAAKNHPDQKVMEAFMYRHHPQWRRAKQIVANGEIGPLRTVQAFFSYFNDDPGRSVLEGHPRAHRPPNALDRRRGEHEGDRGDVSQRSPRPLGNALTGSFSLSASP